MSRLVLVRHGESVWNAADRFTGWTDVDLTPAGEAQAVAAGRLLAEHGLEVEAAFTSVLTRAIRTLWILLHASGQAFVPETKSWRLNERHYGALTGLHKADAAERFGGDQIRRWRRGYEDRPPPMEDGAYAALASDRRYRGVAAPRTESLRDVQRRLAPFWSEQIGPALARGPVLVAAHGNSLRALLSDRLRLPKTVIPTLEIPLANPLVLELDEALQPIALGYLDPSRAGILPPLPRRRSFAAR